VLPRKNEARYRKPDTPDDDLDAGLSSIRSRTIAGLILFRIAFPARGAREADFPFADGATRPEPQDSDSKTAGCRRGGRDVRGMLTFSHFDGAHVRRFEVDPASWALHETISTPSVQK